MTRVSQLAMGTLALVMLSGCHDYGDRYGYRHGPGYGPGYYGDYGPDYYDGYYDGYYGPYSSGYWANDGFFYYYDADQRPHRDEDRHFRHERFEGSTQFHADRPVQHDERPRGDYRDNDRDYDHHEH